MPSWARGAVRRRLWTTLLPVALIASACGAGRRASPEASSTSQSQPPAALLAEARPIGRGAAFQPPARGPVDGRCGKSLGPRFGVHVEVFAANRVVLIPAGIGTRPPRSYSSGRIAGAGCFGALVTLDPTGLVLVRSGEHPQLAELFRSWGQPLTVRRLLSFENAVSAFVDGRPWSGPPGRIPLRRHAEIVLEVGPHVPPHASYTFPPGL
ncbi:MAG: hypothetical protein JO027_06870 [Solirubrobacterales bacterium]|nr:hypothetical protein [Solirubrobacterales bacterium]